MVMSVKSKAALAVTAGVVIAAWGLAGGPGGSASASRSGRRRRRRGAPKPRRGSKTLRGSVVCPAELDMMPPSAAGLRRGDFVAVRVSNLDGSFTELVWGMIDGGSKLPGYTTVRLVPAIGDTEVIAPDDSRHGFAIGDRIEVGKDCLWEVLHTNPHGMALCGTWGEQVAGRPPGGGAPGAAAGATVGMDVLLYLAPVAKGTSLQRGAGWNVENPAWGQIISESPSRNILRVQLLESPPDPGPELKLRAGSRLDITRDCIFGVRPGGSA